MTENKVPVGQYKGELWDRVPEGYLYYIVNDAHRKGEGSDRGFPRQCREEVIRRRNIRPTGRQLALGIDPWEEKHGALT